MAQIQTATWAHQNNTMLRRSFLVKQMKVFKSFALTLLFSASLIFTITSNTLLATSATTYVNSNSPLGINLNAVVDWTTQWPFVDAFKISRPWISQRQNSSWGQGGTLKLTADGWIASLEPGQFAETVMFTDTKGRYPGGQYVLLYDGAGTINFNFSSGKIVSQTPGRMLVDVVPQNPGIWLQILATDPANPIRNIRLIMPGFEKTYQTQPFHPLFLERLSKFKTIRFMDWMATNNSIITNWSDRPRTELATQASAIGVSLTHIVDLANTLHADPWFTMPHQATDDYVRQFATTVRDRLDPSLKPHIEYSNEVWNSIFSQTSYAQQKGLALGLDPTAFSAGLRYYAQRSVEIFKIWEQVFGGKSRLVRILASQGAVPWVGEQVLTWKEAYKNADAYAIAPYYDGDNLSDPANVDKLLQMSEDQVIDNILTEIPTDLKQGITNNYTLATKYGLKLFAYEGGGHLESSRMPADKEARVTALFHAVNRNPRMRKVYLDYLSMWKSSGGQLFNQFYDVGRYDKYGSWGALEYQNQDPSTAPKYLGLMDFIAQNQTVAVNPSWLRQVSALISNSLQRGQGSGRG